MTRTITAAVLGGLVLFLWGLASHMLLPLGQSGVRRITPGSEPGGMAALRSSLPERAIYVFPGLDMSTGPTEAERKAWQERYEMGPAGIVAVTPKPTRTFPVQLATELGTNIVAAFMVALVLLRIPTEMGALQRGGVVGALLGAFEAFDIDASQWNWYGFPTAYFTAQLVDHVIGWFLAGMVIAWICREREEEELVRVPARVPPPVRRPPVRPR